MVVPRMIFLSTQEDDSSVGTATATATAASSTGECHLAATVNSRALPVAFSAADGDRVADSLRQHVRTAHQLKPKQNQAGGDCLFRAPNPLFIMRMSSQQQGVPLDGVDEVDAVALEESVSLAMK